MTMNANTRFCNYLLGNVMKEVKAIFDKEIIKGSWAYIYAGSNGHGEFHIPKCKQFPKGYYWHGNAYNKTEAKASGWQSALAALEERE